MNQIEHKLLVALLRHWFKERLNELKRDIGCALEGTDLKLQDAAPFLVDALDEAFGQLKAEFQKRLQKSGTPE